MVIQDLKATWAYIETGRAVDDFVERDNRKLSQPDVICPSYSSLGLSDFLTNLFEQPSSLRFKFLTTFFEFLTTFLEFIITCLELLTTCLEFLTTRLGARRRPNPQPAEAV